MRCSPILGYCPYGPRHAILKMDDFANFSGARILGYCLHVLGIKIRDRKAFHRKEDYPLQKVILDWIIKNYSRIFEENVRVAKACLHGKISTIKTITR